MKLWNAARTDRASRHELQALRGERDQLQARIASLEAERQLHGHLFHNLAGFGDSLIALRESFAELSGLLVSHRQVTDVTSRESRRSQQALNDMLTELHGVNRRIVDSAEQVASLRDDASHIGQFVGAIEDISMQSTLLAFNASIEAARAGAGGQGFAVVATEVRELASRTRGATDEIHGLKTDILRQAGAVDRMMEDNSRRSERLGIEATGVLRRTDQLLGLSARSDETLSFSAMLSEVELANLEELEIKLEVYRIFMGLSRKTAADLPDETGCALGRWYYEGAGNRRFRDDADFRALEAPHREVHRRAISAVRHFEAGQQEAALSDLASMESANLNVMQRLRYIMRKHRPDDGALALPDAGKATADRESGPVAADGQAQPLSL